MYPLDDDTCSVARSINKFFMKSWWQKMFFFFFFLSPVLGEEEAIMVHAWLPSKEAKRPWWKFPLFGSWQCLGWAWMDLNRLKQIKPSLVPKFRLKYFFGLESWHLRLSQLEPMFLCPSTGYLITQTFIWTCLSFFETRSIIITRIMSKATFPTDPNSSEMW